MKRMFLLPLILAAQAQAIQCQTDQDCLSFGLSLIKKAAKLHACIPEAKAAGKAIEMVAQPNDGTLEKLRDCVETKSYQAKLEKRTKKRIERIQKAFATSEVKS